MISKKMAAFFVLIFLLGVALIYSIGGAQNQGEKLVLYNNFAYYEQNTKVNSNEVSFELPLGVEFDSVKLMLANGYVITQHLNPANYTSESDLLKSQVGKDIFIYDTNGKEIKGRLLKYDGKAYVQTKDGLVIITPIYSMIPGFSGNIEDKNATVVFKLTSSGDARLSYLIDSIYWKPDYTLYLNGNGGTLSLYSVISNNAKDYSNISLNLFYGQMKRNIDGYYYPKYDYYRGVPIITSEAANAPSYSPQPVFEYYKFDLGKTTLPLGESQFSLFEKKVNTIKKTYEMAITGYNEQKSGLAVKLSISNTESNGLGIALPPGSIRVIDADGFVGEDNVLETSKGENVTLNIGTAFDVIGSSKIINQTIQELISCDPRIMLPKNSQLCVKERGNIYVNTYTYEAVVKNNKNSTVDVVLTYNPYGEWVIVDENIPSEKINQNVVKWKFIMPANSEKTLVFTIRQKTGVYYEAAKEIGAIPNDSGGWAEGSFR